MDWERVENALSLLALLIPTYALLRLLGVESPLWWTGAMFGAACLVLLARAAWRRVLSGSWIYKLYRLRRDPAPAGFFHLPRRPGLLERLYMRVRPPDWCKTDDLMIVYEDQGKLLGEGAVVLAVLVQANVALFERGADDAPASVIYTTDREAEQPVARMLSVAQKLFSLKDTRPTDPEEARFARMVSDELGRDFRVTVPDSISGGLDLTLTTIMVHRRHLPEGRLATPYFPLLIHPESRAAMILPARYWPDDFLEEWMRLGEDDG